MLFEREKDGMRGDHRDMPDSGGFPVERFDCWSLVTLPFCTTSKASVVVDVMSISRPDFFRRWSRLPLAGGGRSSGTEGGSTNNSAPAIESAASACTSSEGASGAQ